MIPRGNVFDSRRALASIRAIQRAARTLVQSTHATEALFFDPRVPRALSLGSQLVMASSAVVGTQLATMTGSNEPNSSNEHGGREPKQNRRHHGSSEPSRTDTSSQRVKTLVDIFSRVFHYLAVFPRDSHQAHPGKSNHPDRADTTPFADFRQSGKRLLEQLASPVTLILRRALERVTRIMNDITEFLKANSALSNMAKWISIVLASVLLLGTAVKFLKNDIFNPFMEGLRLVMSPIFALRWFLAKGVPTILSGLSGLVAKVAEFGSMLADIEIGSYLLVGGILAATVGLALAGYELYKHWDAAKRLLSRWIEAVHRTVARLLKSTADKIKSASAYAYATSSIATVTAKIRNALNLPTIAAPTVNAATTARGMNRALAVEHAAAVTPPAPMLHAVWRAAAAAAFAAPLMLVGAPAGAFATPRISTNDTALIASPLPAVPSQNPIVINYAPNVIIHSESGADNAALKRRVMEVLERHGRELHQVLAREIVRQQRRDF
jgi:hypothetical protein